jgi:hypothetical protein
MTEVTGTAQFGASEADVLRLPDGRAVASVHADELRRVFGSLQVPNFNATDGREIAVQKYRALVESIKRPAADAAWKQYVEAHRVTP